MLDESVYEMGNIDIAWCPGCGNFAILKIVKAALAELYIKPSSLVMVSGIGQAAKLPQYMKCNYFNGLHGRSLPAATAIKASNPDLTVIAESGEGDSYGEGGNHFIHAIRRNPNITNLVHNNMVYGLTKGQASPTSQIGFKTTVQVEGVFEEPLNPIALAITMGAGFVARAFAGDFENTKEIIKKAIMHKGYSLVDIFQPCVTFNKTNTFKWFKDNTYYLDPAHDTSNKLLALEKAFQNDKLPLGVFYLNTARPVFDEKLAAYKNSKMAITKRTTDTRDKIASLFKKFV